MKKVIVSLFVLLHFVANGQVANVSNKETIQPLKVGDVVPDFVLGNLVNINDGKAVRVSDYRGKLLILDCWSIHCSSCIAGFPKMKRLSDKYADKLAILPVAFEDKEGETLPFLDKSKGTRRELKLSTVIQGKDNLIEKYFPYWGLPFIIWISPEGKVLGATDNRAVTERNIDSLSKGYSLSLGMRKLLHFPKGYTGSALINIKPDRGSVYGSAFSAYLDSIDIFSSNRIREDYLKHEGNDFLRLFMPNVTLFDLYRTAYEGLVPGMIDDVRGFYVSKSGKALRYKDFYHTKGMDNWEWVVFTKEDLFTYELIMPLTSTLEEVREKMINDVDRYFDLSSRVEKKDVSILKLVSTVPKIEISTNNGVPDEYEYFKDNDSIIIRNRPFAHFADLLQDVLPIPIFDETGIKEELKVDLSINVKRTDVASIRKELQKYNLDIVESIIKRPVLVLSDAKITQ